MALSHSLTQPNLGNTGVSSLIKSASTLQSEINTFNDAQAQITFENNPSEENLQSYLSYLSGRVTNLQSTGTITNATKAITLNQQMHTAIATATSFDVQNTSIQIMAGNATPQDKLVQLGQLYDRAQSVGDVKLAQSLESQAYSLNQTIQYQNQVASDAAVTLSKANETAIKQGYTDAVDAIHQSFQNIVTSFKNGGEDKVNAALKQFVTDYGPAYKQLTGDSLPKGSQLTLGGVAQAVFNAEHAYYLQAADATLPNNPTDAHQFAQQAQDIVSGATTLKIGGVDLNATQAAQWAMSPNLFHVTTNVDGTNSLKMNAVTGYQVMPYGTDANGNPGQLVVPLSNGQGGTAYQSVTNKDTRGQIQSNLQRLGFEMTGNGSDLKVRLTNKTDKWIGKNNPDLKNGDELTLVPLANGGFQFEKNNKVYNIAFDSKGLGGVFQAGLNGSNVHVAGQYGFNQQVNTLVQNGTTSQIRAKLAAQTVALSQKQTAVSMATAQPQGQPAFVPPTGRSAFAAPSVPTQPTSYVQPSSIKPGTSLSAQEMAQARTAVNSLLATKNSGLISNTIGAIQKSAGYGNPYDQFKLSLLPSSSQSGAYNGTAFTSQLVSGGFK